VKVGVTIPTTLDYRNYNGQNYVTSVKNQGSCGCCWSFAATASYESYLRLAGFSYDLSAEAALECTSDYAPNKRVSDCSGGYFPDPFYFLSKVGSVLDSTYPYINSNYGSGAGYKMTSGICTEQNRIFLGNGTISLYSLSPASGGLTVSQIQTLLVTNGPLMIGVYANTGFSFYSSGTYAGCPTNAMSLINHAILLVGWTSTGWIAKNQWGTSWGNAGYIELDFTYDCGLRYLMGSVSVASKNSNVQVVMDPGYTGTTASGWEHSIAASLLAIVSLLAFFVL
jgi:C1A family cysteine protease